MTIPLNELNRVPNQQPKPRANRFYYLMYIQLEHATKPEPLLLTKRVLDNAIVRALKNPEDLQAHRELGLGAMVVVNAKPRFGAASYYYLVHVNADNRHRTLLFTLSELRVAKQRALKNPEDAPAYQEAKGWLGKLIDCIF